MESFRRERGEEPVDQYRDYLDQYVCTVHDLIELTVDLLQLHERAGDVVTEAPLLEALRFCAGPFISEDDLAVLARTTLSRTRLRKDPDAVARIVDTVLLGLDTQRFPWVFEEREATESERVAAVQSTAVLLATERTRTLRRSNAKLDQEGAVASALMDAGLRRVRRPRRSARCRTRPGPGSSATRSTSAAGRRTS